jgi:hypothetical protein
VTLHSAVLVAKMLDISGFIPKNPFLPLVWRINCQQSLAECRSVLHAKERERALL